MVSLSLIFLELGLHFQGWFQTCKFQRLLLTLSHWVGHSFGQEWIGLFSSPCCWGVVLSVCNDLTQLFPPACIWFALLVGSCDWWFLWLHLVAVAVVGWLFAVGDSCCFGWFLLYFFSVISCCRSGWFCGCGCSLSHFFAVAVVLCCHGCFFLSLSWSCLAVVVVGCCGHSCFCSRLLLSWLWSLLSWFWSFCVVVAVVVSCRSCVLLLWQLVAAVVVVSGHDRCCRNCSRLLSQFWSFEITVAVISVVVLVVLCHFCCGSGCFVLLWLRLFLVAVMSCCCGGWLLRLWLFLVAAIAVAIVVVCCHSSGHLLLWLRSFLLWLWSFCVVVAAVVSCCSHVLLLWWLVAAVVVISGCSCHSCGCCCHGCGCCCHSCSCLLSQLWSFLLWLWLFCSHVLLLWRLVAAVVAISGCCCRSCGHLLLRLWSFLLWLWLFCVVVAAVVSCCCCSHVLLLRWLVAAVVFFFWLRLVAVAIVVVAVAVAVAVAVVAVMVAVFCCCGCDCLFCFVTVAAISVMVAIISYSCGCGLCRGGWLWLFLVAVVLCCCGHSCFVLLWSWLFLIVAVAVVLCCHGGWLLRSLLFLDWSCLLSWLQFFVLSRSFLLRWWFFMSRGWPFLAVVGAGVSYFLLVLCWFNLQPSNVNHHSEFLFCYDGCLWIEWIFNDKKDGYLLLVFVVAICSQPVSMFQAQVLRWLQYAAKLTKPDFHKYRAHSSYKARLSGSAPTCWWW